MSLDLFNRDDIVRHLAAIPLEMERVRDTFAAGLAATNRGLRLQAARSIPLPPASLLLSTAAGRLMGWTLRNSSASGNMVVNFYDGRDTSADLIATVSVGSGSAWQQSSPWFGPSGISITDALYYEVLPTGGAIPAGAVYLGAAD